MVKHTQAIRRFVGKLPNCLSVFDHFVKLVLKELSVALNLEYLEGCLFEGEVKSNSHYQNIVSLEVWKFLFLI